jgi:thiol-disulfide isomerase/thioredoxin
MTNGKRFAVGLLAAIAASTAGVYLGMSTREAPVAAAALPREAITSFLATRMNDADGKEQAFAQWRGKTLVINFWATWCSPCQEEMPEFSRLHEKYAANGVQFVGIALDTSDNVSNFSKQHPVAYPLLVAGAEGADVMGRLGNSRLALPYTIVVDRRGEVQAARLGRVPERELDALLQKLIVR